MMASPVPPSPVTKNAFPHNPYVYTTPSSGSTDTLLAISGYLTKCGRRLEETAVNVWTHVRTGSNILDTARGRLNLGARLLTGGGFEQMFAQMFNCLPNEKLIDSFACYISTSRGPISGMLYASTRRIAFVSDRLISYQVSPEKVASGYYRVDISVDKVQMVTAVKNPKNQHEKYIKLVTRDEYEFWFMGFLQYERALKVLEDLRMQY